MTSSADRYETILVERDAGVDRITLNVPARRNAIGPRMTSELLRAFERAAAAEDVRLVVVTGAGSVFCAGGDLQRMSGPSEGDAPQRGDYSDLLRAMLRFEKPIVAKVNGHAMGGGLGLVAASTFAIATTDAQLGTPEINVGLFPMMIMAVVARLVPRRKLLSMVLLGERMTADEAVKIGLLNQAVVPAGLDASVETLVRALVGNSPTATRLGLRAFAAQDDLALNDALPMLRDRLAECLTTEDAREGLTAFLEKRAPQWTGK